MELVKEELKRLKLYRNEYRQDRYKRYIPSRVIKMNIKKIIVKKKKSPTFSFSCRSDILHAIACNISVCLLNINSKPGWSVGRFKVNIFYNNIYLFIERKEGEIYLFFVKRCYRTNHIE